MAPKAADGVATGEKILAQATALFDSAIDLFQGTLDRIKAGEELSFADAEKTARTLAAVTHTLLTIRMKLDDEKRKQGIGDSALDLDDARDHVRRLLDRLRAAKDTD